MTLARSGCAQRGGEGREGWRIGREGARRNRCELAVLRSQSLDDSPELHDVVGRVVLWRALPTREKDGYPVAEEIVIVDRSVADPSRVRPLQDVGDSRQRVENDVRRSAAEAQRWRDGEHESHVVPMVDQFENCGYTRPGERSQRPCLPTNSLGVLSISRAHDDGPPVPYLDRRLHVRQLSMRETEIQ
jgi:hypothetical protein